MTDGARRPPPRTRGWFMQRPMVLAALPAIVGSTLLVAAGLVFPSILPLAVVMAFGASLVVALTSSARVDVGEDGVLVTTLLGRRRFVRYADVEEVTEHEGLRIRLLLRSGDHFDIETRRDENLGKEAYSNKCDALVRSIRAHVEASREAAEDEEADAAERVLAAAWEGATPRDGSTYRARVALEDDVVRGVLRDPNAAFDARAAAAVVLKKRHGDGVRRELTELAESTAEVELRTFFAAAAEREAEAALAELEETMTSRRAR